MSGVVGSADGAVELSIAGRPTNFDDSWAIIFENTIYIFTHCFYQNDFRAGYCLSMAVKSTSPLEETIE